MNSIYHSPNRLFSTYPDPHTIKKNRYAHAWVEINTQALAHNLAQYKQIMPGGGLLAPVIKSNAYGHGIDTIALQMQTNPLVDWLCVAALSEALHVRGLGITKPILVLSIIDADIAEAIKHHIDLIVYDLSHAQLIHTIAKKLKKNAYVHIKIDTGLSRLGILWHESVDAIGQIAQLTHIIIRGLFTHFASSETPDDVVTDQQIARFDAIRLAPAIARLDIAYFHTSCSAAITRYPVSAYNFARIGIGVYGLWSSAYSKQYTQAAYPNFTLIPVLQFKTKIIQIRHINAGSFVGYDCMFQASTHMTLATLPVGYADGIDRTLSNNGYVMINHTPAPIIGRIAMNLMTVDISAIAQTDVGHEVCILGSEHPISADEIARRTQTINYEVTTRIGRHIPRILV